MTSRSRSILVAWLAVVFVAFLVLAGCGSDGQSAEKTASTSSSSEASKTAADETQPEPMTEGDQLYTPSYKPTGDEVAVFTTSKGDISVKLFGDEAPVHVANFVELARKGFYDGTKFHRYIEGFVVQGGDPETRDASSEEVAAEGAKGDGANRYGTGGPGYTIKGEFDPAANPNKHEKGSLGMARSASPDSAGSQFYFALQPLPQLDGQYTVFGKVTKGEDVMESLRAGDEIKAVVIKNASE